LEPNAWTSESKEVIDKKSFNLKCVPVLCDPVSAKVRGTVEVKSLQRVQRKDVDIAVSGIAFFGPPATPTIFYSTTLSSDPSCV
jgi:hypothetical protein